MVADHDHIVQLGLRVDAERQGRVGRRRQHIWQARDLNYVRRVTAARTLGVEGMDGPPFERGDRLLDEPGFVERVGVHADLHVHFVRDRQRRTQDRGRGAPILVTF